MIRMLSKRNMPEGSPPPERENAAPGVHPQSGVIEESAWAALSSSTFTPTGQIGLAPIWAVDAVNELARGYADIAEPHDDREWQLDNSRRRFRVRLWREGDGEHFFDEDDTLVLLTIVRFQ